MCPGSQRAISKTDSPRQASLCRPRGGLLADLAGNQRVHCRLGQTHPVHLNVEVTLQW